MAFCEFCGKRLEDGEVCSCQSQSESANTYSTGTKRVYNNYSRDDYDDQKVVIDAEALNKAKDSVKEVFGKISDAVDKSSMKMPTSSENNMQIVDECITATEQEIPIRQYNIAKLSTPLFKKATGRLQVTNKRILFRSVGRSIAGPVEIESEFSMEEIGGVEIKCDYVFNFLVLLINTIIVGFFTGIFAGIMSILGDEKFGCVFFTLLAVAGFVALHMFVKCDKVWKATIADITAIALFTFAEVFGWEFFTFIGMIILVYGIVMELLSSLVDDLYISFKIKGAHDAIVIGRKLMKDERSGFAIVKPWKDTELAIREIGALLDDIKKFGDAGIEKWRV